MNHKELVARIAVRMELSKQEVETLLESTVQVLTEELVEGKSIGFQSFGAFEVKKKEERLSVHPATQVRTLIPPKLVVGFKQSNVLKEKLKENLNHE